jgi:hypothetical protein
MRPSLSLLTIASALSVVALPFEALSTEIDAASNTPAKVFRRQDIDFELVDESPDPKIAPNNSTGYNQQAAIKAVIAEINEDPLPQKRDLQRREIFVQTTAGYTVNTLLTNAAINAPLNCNNAVRLIQLPLELD